MSHPAFAVILVVRFWFWPDYPAVQVDRFETGAQCRAVAAILRRSTPLDLVLSCEVDT